MTYRCADCGETHDDLPDIGFEHPDPYLDVPDDERADRTREAEGTCVVRDEEGEHYFIRAVILLPIRGQKEPFGIGVWVSQSKKNFDRYVAGEATEPTFGWLSNRIPHYQPSTFLLKTRVHFTGDDSFPTVELEPTDHPLAVDQRNGITLGEAWKAVHHYMSN